MSRLLRRVMPMMGKLEERVKTAQEKSDVISEQQHLGRFFRGHESRQKERHAILFQFQHGVTIL
jgi:hypothetical protein